MRTFLSVAMLAVCTGSAHAQTPTRQIPVQPATGEAAPAAAAEAPAPMAETTIRRTTAADINAATLQAPAELRTTADADAMIQDITAPQNFWWLVGGIVLAGLILAVLL